MIARCLVAMALLCPLHAATAQQAAGPSREAPRIFIGGKEAGWLPKVGANTLPSPDLIEAKARKLAARQRNLDAFALPVFPREPAPKKATSRTPVLNRQAERITLNEALQTLSVHAINLSRGEFLLGGHEVGRGDSVVLGYRGLVFEAVVSEVGPREIRFREKTSGETGVLPHRVLPRFVPQPIQPKETNGLLQGLVRPIPPNR